MTSDGSTSTARRHSATGERPRPNWWGEVALLALGTLITLGGTAMAAQNNDEVHLFGVAAVVLLGIGLAAMPLRRRYPELALGIALSATVAYNALGYAKGPVFFALIVTFVNAVLVGRRKPAIAALVVGFVTMPWLGWHVGRSDRPSVEAILGVLAWLIALLSIAEAVRYRREQIAAAKVSHEEALLRRATDERLRIARELHDVVAHNMSLISIQAGVALHLLDERPEQARDSLGAIKQASKEALVELRSILGVLRQVDEDEESLDGAPRRPVPTLARLEELVERGRDAGLQVALEQSADIDELPRDVDLAAYRIVQESLTNVARHAGDPRVTVRIGADQGGLAVEVLDEGSGSADNGGGGAAVTGDLPSGGNGIIGMRERATAVGGRLEVGPRPGRGFAVRAWLPLTAERDKEGQEVPPT